MEIRFKSGKENHKLDDLISSKEESVNIIGWSSNDDVVIENWKFIDYKRIPTEVYKPSSINKWVYLIDVNFVNCTFKDVNFIGGVPMDGCSFKNCTFENCLLTDHIRWCNFNKCTFNFCIFAGYFHESKFKPNCKFEKVLLSCYGDVYSTLIKGAKCTEDEKIELLKYFYPIEAKVFDIYKIGEPYFVEKLDDYWFKGLTNEFETHEIDNKNYYKDTIKELTNELMDKFKIYKIDNKNYYQDIIKEIRFDLSRYEPEIRIVGKYAPLIDECKPLINDKKLI